MNAYPHPSLWAAVAGLLLAVAASGCGPADPVAGEAGSTEALASGSASQLEPPSLPARGRGAKASEHRSTAPAGPFDALAWKRTGDRGMTCAELAACCPKLPSESQAACQQLVETADETLCSVISSPYCMP